MINFELIFAYGCEVGFQLDSFVRGYSVVLPPFVENSLLSRLICYGIFVKKSIEGFPGGAVVENLPANTGDAGSSPGLGRSRMPRSN